MLSLILSVRQLRQPSGPTELSRFGSRDLGPAANQHSRVLSTSMPNQIQSGDPINQAPFICKAPRNQGSLLSDSPDVCTKSASAAGAGDMFEIEMHCDSPSSSVAQREEREREREVHYLLQTWLQMQATQMSRLCLRSASIPLCRRNKAPSFDFVGGDVAKKV